MLKTEQNAAAVNRVNKKVNDKLQRAFAHMMKHEDGRYFLSWLNGACHLYENVTSPEAEGERRVAVKVRNAVNDLGFGNEWIMAEAEAASFREEMKKMLKQVEEMEDGYEF
jgi:hypothetical protein